MGATPEAGPAVAPSMSSGCWFWAIGLRSCGVSFLGNSSGMFGRGRVEVLCVEVTGEVVSDSCGEVGSESRAGFCGAALRS